MVIDIGSVLQQSQIAHENGEPVVFSIEFIKQDGTVRTYKRARRFVQPKQAVGNGTRRKALYNLKKSNSILIWDVDTEQHRTIKISRITKFNGKTVRH